MLGCKTRAKTGSTLDFVERLSAAISFVDPNSRLLGYE
jgi:hypothetical protein